MPNSVETGPVETRPVETRPVESGPVVPNQGPSTIGAVVRWGARQLAKSSTPALDARLIVQDILGLDHADLIAQEAAPIPTQPLAVIKARLIRRADGEPLAYILGHQEFYGRSFAVSPEVLIPRPETEMLVDAGVALAPRTVLDLGTGSGCLLLSLLAECPAARGVGIDLSARAVAQARQNADRLGVQDRATLRCGDFSQSQTTASPQVDLIVANPPYIETGATLPRSVSDFEPQSALFAGPDGLEDYRALAPTIAADLAPHGTALLEIGTGQGTAVANIMAQAMPDRAVTVARDLAGHERMVTLLPIR